MASPTQAPKLCGATPVFVVADVVRSAEYYRDVLGFRFDRYWGEPPCFVIVHRDAAEIFFKQACPDAKLQSNFALGEVWDAYFTVTDVGALHREFVARGARILSAPQCTVYEMMEMEVEDPDGYRLCFAQDTSGAPGGQ